MSTLTSSDLSLKRPTTRVQAPPGGGSNVSFGYDQVAPKQAPAPASPPIPAQDPVAKPSVEVATAVPTSVVSASKLRVGILKAGGPGDCVDQIEENCLKNLKGFAHETFVVPSVDLLPYAANKLLSNASENGFHAVVCVGVLDPNDVVFQAVASSLTQSLMEISMQTLKPVVRKVLMEDSSSAIQTAKSGYGKDVADHLEDLIRLGGLSDWQSASSHQPVKLSNVLPEKIINAPADVQETLEVVRQSLYEHGARSVATFGRKFRIIDDNGNRRLDLDEFSKAIEEHHLGLSSKAVEDLFRFIDADGSGEIDYDEFLVALRGEMNERRKEMALIAFERLDADKNGVVDVEDLKQKYSAMNHPDVKAGKKRREDVLADFLDTFDGGDKDGKVYPGEFLRYYATISASIDDDDYFELIIRNAWHISGGEGWSENSTCRRVLVTHEDGRQTVEEVKDDLNIKGSDTEAIKSNLKNQGIDADKVSLAGSAESKNEQTKTPGSRSRMSRNYGGGPSSIVFG